MLANQTRSGEPDYPQPSEAASGPTVLSIGDTFYVEVEGETLAVEVGA